MFNLILSFLPAPVRAVVGSKVFLWGLSIFLVLSLVGYIYLKGYWNAEADIENENNKVTIETLEKANEIEKNTKKGGTSGIIDGLGIPR